MTASVAAYLDAFRRRRPSGPQWAERLRREGIERFCESGFPTRGSEDWRYTDLGAIARTVFQVGGGEPVVAAEEVAPYRIDGALELVFVDGTPAPQLSAVPDLPGVRVRLLRDVLAEEEAPPLAPATVAGLEHPFAALNTAFLEQGVAIEATGTASPPALLHLLFFWTPAAAPTAVFPRVLVRVAEGAGLDVLETHAGSDGESAPRLAVPVTEAAVEAGAALRHTRLAIEPENCSHVALVAVSAAPGASLQSRSFVFGHATLTRVDVSVRLDGEGANCVLDGLYVPDARGHVDHHTFVDHAVPACRSDQLYKGILYGRARGVFDGRVVVRPGAQGSDAHQLNRNLLLSDDAVVDAKPRLEIFADDVRCTHGATIGQLEGEALFYLRARGLGLREARGLLIEGFGNEVVDRVAPPAVRGAVERVARPRLAEAAGEGGAT